MPRARRPAPRKRRRRGSGTVVWNRRLEKWEARLPRTYNRQASYHERKSEAEVWLAEQLAQRAAADRLPDADELLGEYLQRWYLRRRGQVGASRLAQARHMGLLAEPLAAVPLGELRFNHIADWCAQLLARGLGPSTVALNKQMLAQALSDLVPDVLASNPAARSIRMPRQKSSDPEHLEALQAQRLLRVAAGTPGYPLWRLLLGTGIRVGEALGLTWQRVNLEAGLAEISGAWSRAENRDGPTKSGTVRTVALAPQVVAALEQLPHREGWVFPSTDRRRQGQPLSHSIVSVWFRKLAAPEAANLPPSITPHSLRHTFASLALSRGIPITTVSAALGHANTGVTSRIYSHALQSRAGDAERAVDDVLGQEAL